MKAGNEGWKDMPVNEDVKMWLRTKGTQVEVKVKGKLNCSVVNILTMIYLNKLYKDCLPFCSKAEEVVKISTL